MRVASAAADSSGTTPIRTRNAVVTAAAGTVDSLVSEAGEGDDDITRRCRRASQPLPCDHGVERQ